MRIRLLRFAVLVAALAGFAIPAHANKDMVQFGSTIRVAPGETIHDAVCFFCSVDNRGTIDHDVVVFFGNVHIDGRSNHDVVTFFGRVKAEKDAVIGHDLVNFFGRVRLGENVTVGQNIVVMFGTLHAEDGARNNGDRVVQPGWIFWAPLLIFLTIIILVVREVRASRRRAMFGAYPYPPPPPQ